MQPPKPHYLLFSEARTRRLRRSSAGVEEGTWRFQLESVDGTSTFEATDEESQTTRERLELLAIVRGLEALDQPSHVTLLTASRYVSHGMRFGLQSWRDSDWRWEEFGRMAPVPNSDLWQRIDRAMQFHNLRCKRWEPVRQHAEARPGGVAIARYVHGICRKATAWLLSRLGRGGVWIRRDSATLCPQG